MSAAAAFEPRKNSMDVPNFLQRRRQLSDRVMIERVDENIDCVVSSMDLARTDQWPKMPLVQ